MESNVTTFDQIEVNGWFKWSGLTFVKTSSQHAECLDDETKSQLFHDIAPVTPVVDEPKPKSKK